MARRPGRSDRQPGSQDARKPGSQQSCNAASQRCQPSNIPHNILYVLVLIYISLHVLTYPLRAPASPHIPGALPTNINNKKRINQFLERRPCREGEDTAGADEAAERPGRAHEQARG